MSNSKPILVHDAPAVLPHRVLKPEKPGPHPTVVMIHGYLGNEDVMWIFSQTLPLDWLLVAPRAIVQEGADSFSWHSQLPSDWPTLADFDTAVDQLTKFISTLPDKYNADPEQIYLMGFSQGAAAAFALAIREPERVQGIASLVGFMPYQVEDAMDTARLSDIPVFMAVGTEDDSIPLDMARECGKAVRAMGAFLEYREYDTGHKLNRTGMRKLRQWWMERLALLERLY
ncbi:alpha/beta hydrolase [Candidatus Leptofilum sp.]|uniref:alpha/beta hydrolase n=1 Tax=Candidatus Leptofilum sp. TaxID=3241576 RepID=UPI003B5C525E